MTAPAPLAQAACCTPIAQAALDAGTAASLATALKALAEPTRLRIISLIASAPDGELCVCDLPGPLGLTQPTISHHLKVLTDAGFFAREKRGTWSWFRLVPGALDAVTRPLAEPARAPR